MGLKLQSGSVLTLPPIADTYADQASPATNYGSSGSLKILGYSGYYSRSYLNFDVGDLDPDDIESAVFYIFYEYNDVPDREQRHHIKRITSDWAEETLTYNNAPTFNGEGAIESGSYGTLVNVDGHLTGTMKWRSVNLTNLIKEWLAGTYSNFGLVIDHNYHTPYDGGTWATLIYRSKEYSGTGYDPYLKVTLKPKTSGHAIYGPYDLSDAVAYSCSDISWTATIPEDTSLVVKTAVRNDSTEPYDEEYSVATSGEAILGLVDAQDLSSASLWIKVEMTTTDAEVTPEITELSWYVANAADAKKIRVTLSSAGQMEYPQGDVAVIFTGSLLGPENAAVAPFIEGFTPVNITPVFNPNDPEYIELIDATAQAVSHAVEYLQSQSTPEYIELAAATAVAIRYHIDDIPE